MDFIVPAAENDAWPELPYPEWRPTCTALHLWSQMVGKIRLAQEPWVNHGWHSTLYATPRGLTTSPIHFGTRTFQLDFDLVDHFLLVEDDAGRARHIALGPTSVARFHSSLFGSLEQLGLPVRIHGRPNEMPDAVPFARDRSERPYDRDAVDRFRRVLLQVDRVFKQFRSSFVGKVSPVHLFWGSFDLAVTRFSGRAAPPHPGGFPGLPDEITREAYSHEVSSAGFFPGGGGIDFPAFYSYAYPTPAGFGAASIQPAEAFFEPALGEFLLPYEAVRTSRDPDAAVLAFLQSTYEAAADLGQWDRAALECEPGRPRVPSKSAAA